MSDRKTISECRNPHKPMAFVVEFECEESRQFDLTPEALALLEEHGLVPDVDATMGLDRKAWKEARQPKSSGTTWGFSNSAMTIGKSQL